MRKTVNVEVNERAASRLHAMGISPSKLCAYLMDSWLNEHEDDIGTLFKILMLEEKVKEIETKLVHLESLKALHTSLKAELEITKSEYNDDFKNVEHHHLLQYLNKRIIMYKYNKDDILSKHEDILKRIYELDPKFDLDAQIALVQQLRRTFTI